MNDNGQPTLAVLPEPPPATDQPVSNGTKDSKRNGKIPHLSKEQRDLVNHMFDEGATYQAVSRKFAWPSLTR